MGKNIKKARGPKMAKIQYGVKPDIFKYALVLRPKPVLHFAPFLSNLKFFSCFEHFFEKVSESNPTFFVRLNPTLNPSSNPKTPKTHP